MSLRDTYILANGVEIPIMGFGTGQARAKEAYNAVKWALEAGYRHIDTAATYDNEVEVGQAIKDSGIARDQIFVTTKVWDVATNEAAAKSLEESLEKLQMDYVDLYLIHWPNHLAFRPNYQTRNKEVWRALEDGLRSGKARAIGVSNFRQHHLETLFQTAEIKPMVNQLFINPSDQEEELVIFNKNHGILTEAYSPLGTGKMFGLPGINDLAEKYHKSVAQILLRWSLEKGYLPLPKSITQSRIIENSQIFDFILDKVDSNYIDGLHGLAGLSDDPDTSNV